MHRQTPVVARAHFSFRSRYSGEQHHECSVNDVVGDHVEERHLRGCCGAAAAGYRTRYAFFSVLYLGDLLRDNLFECSKKKLCVRLFFYLEEGESELLIMRNLTEGKSFWEAWSLAPRVIYYIFLTQIWPFFLPRNLWLFTIEIRLIEIAPLAELTLIKKKKKNLFFFYQQLVGFENDFIIYCTVSFCGWFFFISKLQPCARQLSAKFFFRPIGENFAHDFYRRCVTKTNLFSGQSTKCQDSAWEKVRGVMPEYAKNKKVLHTGFDSQGIVATCFQK